MNMTVRLSALVSELAKESYEEGYQRSLYSHAPHFHTVEQRDKYKNHEAIVEKIKAEIEAGLKELGGQK